jgi:uncharacterized membrane protein
VKRVLILVVPCLAAFALTAPFASGATVQQLVKSTLTAKSTPKADTVGARTFKVTGKMAPAAAVTKCAAGVTNLAYCSPAKLIDICVGSVRVTIKRGLTTLARGTVKLKLDCSYSAKIKMKASKIKSHGKLSVVSRFLGNALVAAKNSKTVKLKV